MDGRRLPLSWPKDLRARAAQGLPPLYTLVDAASLGATSQLHLSSPEYAADFTILSLYKIFGFPPLGALILRRSAGPVFDHRRYFGGGTVDLVTCDREACHVRKTQSLHERLEDGTLPFQSIMAVGVALKVHKNLYYSMERVGAHTRYLTRELCRPMTSLRHANGRSVCILYSSTLDTEAGRGTGPILSFNLLDSHGSWVRLSELEKLATLRRVHVRTGGLCCPGGIASALGLEPWELKRNLSAGFRCGTESEVDVDKPAGVIRASFGAMSILSDVVAFVDFIKEFFVEANPTTSEPGRDGKYQARVPGSLRVKSITIFPIKSCGGFALPADVPWEVRPEGLVWDREWCLFHRGSGQVLSQKRYPSMALLRPLIDVEHGRLRVEYHDGIQCQAPPHTDIPLFAQSAYFDEKTRQMPSRVCGDTVHAQAYVSEAINDFFTKSLGVPCILARFPPGGRGLESRTSKARVQDHQRLILLRQPLVDVPSPPDSDSEQQQKGKILLSNESSMLLVHASSVDALNSEIKSRGGEAVSDSAFRANVTVERLPGEAGEPPYSEDSWSGIRIGHVDFKLLGACRRCQMVCVDQTTAQHRREPLTTLAKTRRIDGKVYFGTHMCYQPQGRGGTASSLAPTIQIGAPVTVYKGQPEGEMTLTRNLS